MRASTKGIVLNFIPFSESAVVANIYTQLHGMQSFLVSNVRGRKSSNKLSFFQPLTIVEIEAYFKNNSRLQKLTKIQPEQSFQFNSYSPIKSSIAFFLSEIIYKSLRESEAHIGLFEFLAEKICLLQNIEEIESLNFHIYFLLSLSKQLGFCPEPFYNKDNNLFFDLKEGNFSTTAPKHSKYIAGKTAETLNSVLHSTEMNKVVINRNERKVLLASLIEYYSLHIPGIGQIKSLSVLEAIFE